MLHSYMSIIRVGQGQGRNAVQRAPKDVEDRVQGILQDLDRHLYLEWHPTFQRYFLANKWHDADPRWELHRSGELGDPYDILGWFTDDMDNAHGLPQDPLAMMDRVLDYLGEMDQTRETWKTRMKRSIEHNKKVQKDLRREGAEELTDALVYNRKRVYGEPIKRGVLFDANGKVVET